MIHFPLPDDPSLPLEYRLHRRRACRAKGTVAHRWMGLAFCLSLSIAGWGLAASLLS